MNRSMPGLPVHHQLPEFTQTHVHGLSDAIQPSHPLSSPFPLTPNPSQHQGITLLEKCKSKLQWGITSHPSEWPTVKNLQTINAGEDVEKRKHACTLGGNVNWYRHYGEQYGHSSSKTKKRSIIWSSNPTTGHKPRENHNSRRHMHLSVHCSIIYNS